MKLIQWFTKGLLRLCPKCCTLVMRRTARHEVISLTVAVFLLGSCVTPTVVKPPAGTVDFKRYKTVNLVMTDGVNTPYSKGGIFMFKGLLQGKLQSLGYSSVNREEDIRIEVRVTGFNPGSAAARFFIGFGAGRSLLTYTASFKDKSGTLITELEGGKSYHGMELSDNPLFYTEEKIKMGMIQEAVIQIAQFIQNNGQLEETSGE